MSGVGSTQLGAACLSAALALAACAKPADPPPDLSPAARVVFYEQQLATHPRHWPAAARLGLAWLDRARETLDPADLQRARAALASSREIQDSFEARKGLAAAAAFAHRFDEAQEWLELAREANPDDTALIALEVEAALATGRLADAHAALALARAADFHVECARGALEVAEGRLDAAVGSFERAAEHAETQGVPSLATWARVRAAGVLLDAGRLDEARPKLAAIARSTPDDRELRIHQSELHEQEGEHELALTAIEALLAERDDAHLRARACVLARTLGRAEQADQHRAHAERILRRAVDAGEVYTLGALARLLLADDGDADEARTLAERNLEHVSDAEAASTLERARSVGGGS